MKESNDMQLGKNDLVDQPPDYVAPALSDLPPVPAKDTAGDTTLRVASLSVDAFVGFVDDKRYEITADGNEVPSTAVDALKDAALREGILLEEGAAHKDRPEATTFDASEITGATQGSDQ